MIKNVIRLAIIGLIVHALYQFVPVYVRYQQFKDDVQQAALFARGASESEIAERVMAHARQRQVPLDPAGVTVRRVATQLFVDATYQQPVRVLPWYVYTWKVHVAASPYVAPEREAR